MGDIVELSTRNSVDITNGFYKVTSNAVSFEVKGNGPAFIGLASEPGRDDVKYWIGIEQNRKILMIDGLDRDMNDDSWVTSTQPDSTLNPQTFTRFWITWHNDRLNVGDGTNIHKPVINEEIEYPVLYYVTFVSGGPCDWRIDVPPVALVKMSNQPKPPKPLTDGQPQWVNTDSQLPDESIIGGYENGELLYIIRGPHRRSLTPGKFVPSEGVAYICWGGTTHVMEQFEVLQGYNFQWTPTTGCEIPKNALVGGYSEDGDKLYVGRGYHDGHLIVGKVQPKHTVCYLPYRNREIPMDDYEILTVPDLNAHVSHDYFVNNLFDNIGY